MSKKSKRSFFGKHLLLILAVVAAGLFVSFVKPTHAYAYVNNDKLSEAQQHDRTQLYAILRCFELSGGLQLDVSGSQINQGAIWSTTDSPDGNSNEIPLGYEIDNENGERQCQNLDYDGALSFIGMTYQQFWKTAYGQPDADGNYHKQPGKSTQLHQEILDKVKAKRQGSNEVVGPKEKDRRVLIGLNRCVQLIPDGKAATSGKVSGMDGYEWRDGKDENSTIPMGQDLTFYDPASGSPDDGTYTCGTLVNLGKGALKRLPKGTTLAQAGAAGGSVDSSSSASGDLSCEYSANALSWIICPAVGLMTDAIEETDSIITKELDIPQQDIFCTNQKTCNDYYAAWSSFRDISLGLLAIAGLVTIVAQAIGMEILDAYTIRKMLPRILVAAIGITLSWTLMNFAVTLSNNLGFGVRDLILAPFNNVLQNSNISFSTSAGAFLAGLTGFILGIGALVAGIGILLSYIATAGLAVIIAVTVLVIRQLVIIMLMILSPVALIAYVLPNTERVYRMWWEAFIKALLMFPLIVGFIAAGRVFAAIALTNGEDLFSQLTAMVAYFGPYFVIPLTFRMSGGIMSSVGSFVNERGQPLAGRLSKYRGEKAAAKLKNARAGKLFDENFGRFTIPQKVPWLGGKETGIGEMYNRAAVNLTDQDELLPWRLGRPRDKTNPLTGKKWQGMWGMRRGAKDLQDQLDNRAINESTKAMEEVGDMHYEAWRGVAGQHQDFTGRDASGKLISQRLAEAGFVDKNTGAIKAPSSIGDFEKMGNIMMESDNDKEALGGEDLLAHSGTLASVKHRPDMEYADTQVMAAIALSSAGRAEPEALANIGNSIKNNPRLGKGVAQRTMKAAQKAASRQERPDLRDGHGIILNRKTGEYESSYSEKNYKSKTAIGSVISSKGSAWSGAKSEAVKAASPTIKYVASGKALADGAADADDQQAVLDSIRDGIRSPYNDPGQRKEWRKIAREIGREDMAQMDPMTTEEWASEGGQPPPQAPEPEPPPEG